MLYQGYVKHANHILGLIQELQKDTEKHAYAINELRRRFSFEWGGMRNHEYYFESLTGGPLPLSPQSTLSVALSEEFGDFETWLSNFKALALTRGIGWAMLSYDQKTKRLMQTWVDEQHLGQLIDTKPILALDMWEHSFVADYLPSGKKQYVEDFFKNINWSIIENNFTSETV